MDSPNERRSLWDPSSGIRFSPSPAPLRSSVLYPQLEYARFIHLHDLGAPNNEAHRADTVESWVQNKSTDDLSKTSSPAELAPRSVQGAGPGTHAVGGTGFERDTPPQVAAAKPEARVTPPITHLKYNISHDMFHAARAAKKGTPDSYWSYTMYEDRQADGLPQKVKVHYCTSKHTTEHVCQKYFLGEDVIGFDMEWNPYSTRASGPRDNVSLIQIASPGRIGLFHVALFPQKDELVAPTFRKIMGNPEVLKVGVNIQADCTRLKNNLAVKTQGIFELSHLYKLVKYTSEDCVELIDKRRVALAVQVEEILQLPLYKGDNVRSSNWTLPLNHRQITYSASDAYAGLQLFYILEERRKSLDPAPPRPRHAELGLPIEVVLPTPKPSDIDDNKNAATPAPRDAPNGASPPPPQPNLPAKQSSTGSMDPRMLTADKWMKQYRATLKRPLKAGAPAMRAYYIWYSNTDLNPEAIAKILRNPPLKTNTVVTYILDALSAENLPYSTSRLQEEVLSHLAVDISTIWKYRSLAGSSQKT